MNKTLNTIRVFSLLLNNVALTAEQISAKMPTLGINTVRSRLTELKNDGLVKKFRVARVATSGVRTALWGLNN
jgi:Fe2+ or Zn2+ uptake regulation protein